MTGQTKRCVTCKTEKPTSEYGRNKSTTDGLHRQCKECRREAYQAAKARKANGETPRKRDDTITPGNPLSDPFTADGWPTMMSVAASVAGRIHKQHGGWHQWPRTEIESAAVEWVTDHRAEASRCTTEAMAVVKIAERVMRDWRKALNPTTPKIDQFPINVIDHEIAMDAVMLDPGFKRPGETIAAAALRRLHQRAEDYPYIDAMTAPGRISYDQVQEWIGTWDQTPAGAPSAVHIGRFERDAPST
ncbi:hypothetical protein M3C58_00420 [Brachybacterium muris]|uniref:hypothetical protein n=1 Tax=Brachybacterium muris TaxID=219301 RepID=UPI00223BFF5F|nr:hypothetical protein [Brachybacterium muris]MCT1653661.1 hypothetical protein [Brachybacterium muris]MCT1996682.1 hypothetical protein [Brachybacterium muris]